jgi:hypothetical protein
MNFEEPRAVTSLTVVSLVQLAAVLSNDARPVKRIAERKTNREIKPFGFSLGIRISILIQIADDLLLLAPATAQ